MAYLLFLNVVMLTRLGYLMRESPAGRGATWIICGLQVLSLGLFVPGWRLLLLAGVLILLTALAARLERRGLNLAGVRSLVFLAVSVAGAMLLGGAELAAWSASLLPRLASFTLWTADLEPGVWQRVNVVAFGLLLLTNEVNLVIRYGFHRLNLEPKVEADAGDGQPAATDQRQYNAGRVIGILERYFILVLLLADAHYAALAAILAAKGFARFKQLDRREFAEYILIGTLASALSAVLVGLLVMTLLRP